MDLKVIFRYAHLFPMTFKKSSTPSSSVSSSLSSMTPDSRRRRYIPIQQAHIDGCTYIEPGGLQFVQQLLKMGGRVKVPTSLNAVSTDRRFWSQYRVPREYAHHAIAIGVAYLALGCQPTYIYLRPIFVTTTTTSTTSTTTYRYRTTTQRNRIPLNLMLCMRIHHSDW